MRLLGIVALVILLVGCGGSSKKSPTPATTAPGAVGTPVALGAVSLTVNKVALPVVDPSDTFDQPKAGTHYVVLDISISNNGDDELDPDNDIRWSITDSTGRAFTDALDPPTTQPAIPTIDPHGIGRGEVGFEVANDAAGLTLVAEIWAHSDSALNFFDPTAVAQAVASVAANGFAEPIGKIRVSLAP